MAEESKARREIVLITKTDTAKKDRWDMFERVSKTLSIAAIPVVLGVGGWYIQQQLQNQTVSRDYVQLAVSILKEPDDKTKIKPELRAWAIDLLREGLNQKQVEFLGGPITTRAKRLQPGTKNDPELSQLITSLLDKR